MIIFSKKGLLKYKKKLKKIFKKSPNKVDDLLFYEVQYDDYKTVSITKSQIISSIKNSTLKGGSFFYDKSNIENCEVCAVGAIIREVLGVEYCEERIAEDLCQGSFGECDNLKALIEEENWLGALSVFFERKMSEDFWVEHATVREKLEIINFIEDYFPPELEVEIPIY